MFRLTRTVGAAAIAATLLAATNFNSPAQAQAGKTPLKHIIVVYMENWG